MRHARQRWFDARRPLVPAAVAFLLLVALLLPGPSAARGKKNKKHGSVAVFIVASGTPTQPGSIELRAIAAIDTEDAETPLELNLDRLDTAGPSEERAPLASGRLASGLYRGLRLVLSRDTDPSAAAPDVDRPEPITVFVPGDFRVERSESVTLTVHFGRDGLTQAPDALADRFRLRRNTAAVVRRLTLYVTNETEDSVMAINRDDAQVFSVIPVGDRPRGIDVTASGRHVFVANSGDDTVSVIDSSTHTVVDTFTLKTGCRPEDVAVGQDGRRLVVSCPGLNLLTLLDPLTNARIGEIGLTRKPGRIAIGRDQRTVYALIPEGNQIVRADLLRPGSQVRASGVDARPTDLGVDPLTGRVFVTHARAPLVSSFDAQLNPARQLQVGTFSYGIAVEADGRRLYASGGDAGGLALIGPQVGTIIRRWNAPTSYHIALDPDGRKVYLTGGRTGTLLVIDRIAGRVVREVRIGKSATDLVLIP